MRTRSAWVAVSATLVLAGAVALPAACGSTPAGSSAQSGVSSAALSAPVRLATDRSRRSAAVVASGGAAAPYNYAPSVVLDGGSYRMWWCSQLPDVGTPGDDVLTASSAALDGPFGQATAAFHGSGTGFDAVHTCDPSVLKVKGTYYLYYTGSAGDLAHGNAIGLATSQDGITWQRRGDEPVVVPSLETRRDNAYGVGQPSALYLDGWFYLMFTDTTAKAAGWNGAGQFVLRSPDPSFATGTQQLTASGFTPTPTGRSDGTPRAVSIVDAFSADWMWVDALDAFAVAHEADGRGTVVTFWNRDFTAHPYAEVVLDGPWQEGPGLVRRADGHAPASADDPCDRVPVDLVRAVRQASAPTDLMHFGVDLTGVGGCRSPATLDGFAMPAPDRTVVLVVDGHLVHVDRRSVADQLAAAVLDTPVDGLDSLPVVAAVSPGAAAVHAPDRPYALLLDGKLWPVGSARAVQFNSSPVSEVSDEEWDGMPKGSDLSLFGRGRM
ncbi:MAG: beta-xylosidase [Kutzneria sp.]|nr:beta-xylosidase [Kutzneria sp.]